jgi:hypothetical protein
LELKLIYKALIFLVLSSACFGQELWNGTRYGMSVGELQKLFGSRLKPDLRRPDIYSLTEHFCRADFGVYFHFPVPDKGLDWIDFESLSGNAEGAIGECVLAQLTAKFGHPQLKERQESGAEYRRVYWFGHRSSKQWEVLTIQDKRVNIHYQRERPPEHEL